MSDISRIGDAYNWSIAKIAEAFGIDRKTVRKKIMNAQIASAGNIRGNPVYALKDIGPVLFTPVLFSLPLMKPPQLKHFMILLAWILNPVRTGFSLRMSA